MNIQPVEFRRRLLLLGFGCVGQGVLPLLLRHIAMRPKQLLIISAHDTDKLIADSYGVSFLALAITQDNFQTILASQLEQGDILLNLTVGVSSLALIELCRAKRVLYLDTCLEPWSGVLLNGEVPIEARTNYAQRERVLAMRSPIKNGPTAVVAHGANPGLISHFLKQALLNVARDTGLEVPRPHRRSEWAHLASRLGVRAIHIAERDTQTAAVPRRAGQFINTWSVDAFIDEACQPSELGWGTHERHFPADGLRHTSGSCAAIYLNRPGASTLVRTWTPAFGPMLGYLITHAESISIAEYFTESEGENILYRPTVNYAYRPCDDAVLSLMELADRNWQHLAQGHILKDDIVQGVDALGVLIMGHRRVSYWYGSQLSIEQARALCPHNSATSLQIAAGAMAGVVWAIRNPECDIVEPDDLPFEEIIAISRPYLGDVQGFYTDWNPLAGRSSRFVEDTVAEDPWQFKNFRVT